MAAGYFEWLKPEKRSEPRHPFYFRVDGGAPFAFAALWTPARIDGERIESVVLLTCDSRPNPVAAGIHDRMPVILADDGARRAWLDPSLDVPDLLDLCQALPAIRAACEPGRQQARGARGSRVARCCVERRNPGRQRMTWQRLQRKLHTRACAHRAT